MSSRRCRDCTGPLLLQVVDGVLVAGQVVGLVANVFQRSPGELVGSLPHGNLAGRPVWPQVCDGQSETPTRASPVLMQRQLPAIVQRRCSIFGVFPNPNPLSRKKKKTPRVMLVLYSLAAIVKMPEDLISPSDGPTQAKCA